MKFRPLPVFPGLGNGWNPEADTVRNFCHQVGSLYAEDLAFVPAEAGSAQPTVNAMLAIDAAAAKARSRAICPGPSKPFLSVSHGMRAQAGDNDNHAHSDDAQLCNLARVIAGKGLGPTPVS